MSTAAARGTEASRTPTAGARLPTRTIPPNGYRLGRPSLTLS
jgi:hypothetical protein